MVGEALDLLVVGAVLVENCPVAELEVGEVSFLEGWHLGEMGGLAEVFGVRVRLSRNRCWLLGSGFRRRRG